MGKRFKFLPSVPLSYQEQGRIFFTCQTYRKQPEEVQAKIRAVCTLVGGGDGMKRRAILDFMTTRKSWRECCMTYYISDATLDRLRRAFYREWGEM